MVRKKGSITVFLSLAGLLIFALIGTCLETARLSVCANHGRRTLRTGTDALLTEYSRPLYDHYKLFFLESEGTPYERVIADYVGDMLNTHGTMDFISGECENIDISKKVKVVDDGANALKTEISECMKREVAADGIDFIKEKLGLFKDSEKEAEEIDEKVEKMKKEAELDVHLLKLMRLVDGVIVDNGKVAVVKNFAKMFSFGAIKKEKFGIDESSVWKKVKKNIIKIPKKLKSLPLGFSNNIDSCISKTEKAIEVGEKLREDYNSIHADDDGGVGMVAGIIAGLDSLTGNLNVLKETKNMLESGVMDGEGDEWKATFTALWENYDTSSVSFDYSGVNESDDGENPVESLGESIGDGFLGLVCKNVDKLSEKKIKGADKYATSAEDEEESEEEEDEEDVDADKRLDKFASDEEVELSGVLGDIGTYTLDEFYLDSYIEKFFTSYKSEIKDKKWERGLDYQWEYIIAGGARDKGNLESVLSRILMIRAVTNFAAIFADSSKKAQAYAAAAAVVGFTGLEPLIRLMEILIIIDWAFVESLVDLAGLLKDKDVPVIKTSKQILTTFPEIFLVTNSAITSRAEKFKDKKKTSFGYKEYMLLFFATMSQEKRRYRVMDLIEKDMRKNDHEGFKLGKCVYQMQVDAQMEFPSKFFRMPSISRLLGRNIGTYHFSCRVNAGYL